MPQEPTIEANTGRGLVRLSLSAFAKLEGVTQQAVSKQVSRGQRLRLSVGRDERGRPFIADLELAKKEWAENSSRPTKRARAVPAAAAAAAPAALVVAVESAEPSEPATLIEAQFAVAVQRARQLKMANDIRQGQLIDANQAAKDAFESARVLREAVLNLPSRLAPELAAETDANCIFTRLDAELRQALELVSTELAS
jgi:hypothetical protein